MEKTVFNRLPEGAPWALGSTSTARKGALGLGGDAVEFRQDEEPDQGDDHGNSALEHRDPEREPGLSADGRHADGTNDHAEAPPSSPFAVEPSERLAMSVSPRTATQKYSGGPKRRESSARGGERKSRKRAPAMPPTAEATVARLMASRARPCLAMG